MLRHEGVQRRVFGPEAVHHAGGPDDVVAGGERRHLVMAWILFSLGFAYYIGNFGSYNRVSGSLAAVIILLV